MILRVIIAAMVSLGLACPISSFIGQIFTEWFEEEKQL